VTRLALDDTNTVPKKPEKEGSEEQLSLLGVQRPAEKPKPAPLDFIQLIRGLEKPTGHPQVGAGTGFSDIIRDRYPNDVRFHLGPPRTDRFDISTLPDTHKNVPTDTVPGVPMENVGASQQFVDKMRKEIDGLPPPVRKLLKDKDMTVVVTDEMVDAAPDLKNQHPRGWPPGTTYENEDGAFRPEHRHIMVAEKFRSTDGKEVYSDRAEGVVRHEAGHAVDAALDNYSQEAEFKAAYDKDVAAMSADTKEKLKYLLQGDGAGEQECFAEVFAALNGGSANAAQTQLILQTFPNVADAVRKKLASLPS